MLGKKPIKVYDHFLKYVLDYKNPERIKKAIAAQPKMYDGEILHSVKLKIDSPDSEENSEDAEESRLKMRNKMVQINYGKLNALYETFVPRREFSVEQTYISIIYTSNNGSESKEVTSDLPIPKMPKESKFQNSLREFYKTDVILMSASLSKNLKELKEELIEEVKEMNSSVKKALFTTPIAAKSKNLGATSVDAKSRLSVAKTTTAKNKLSSMLPLSPNYSQSMTLSNYIKNKIATSRKWHKWFEIQQCFNWTPKSKTAQSLPSETKSRDPARPLDC
ncbi:hypothetical protein Tco_1180010 [Tanacetum coccineum]